MASVALRYVFLAFGRRPNFIFEAPWTGIETIMLFPGVLCIIIFINVLITVMLLPGMWSPYFSWDSDCRVRKCRIPDSDFDSGPKSDSTQTVGLIV